MSDDIEGLRKEVSQAFADARARLAALAADPVRPATRLHPVQPYGCHNRPEFPETTVMQDGWDEVRDGYGNPVRVARWRDVPMRMARPCHYTHTSLGQADARCAGCFRRTDQPRGD